jgi:hypothetical protein
MSMERSTSPTLQRWNQQTTAWQKKALMMGMGLHVFNDEWAGHSKGRIYSTSFKEITMKIFGSNETLTFPVQTCTRVGDVKEALANSLMVNKEDIIIIQKQGPSHRIQLELEEVGKTVTVRGIKSFKVSAHKWPHPTGIIGSGYHGLKTLIMYVKSGNNDVVCWDRNTKLGGYCWITAANKTSKLQTEIGAFHVWWGQEMLQDNISYPKEWSTWPFKEEIQQHFEHAADCYGVRPHIHFGRNVAKMDIIGAPKEHNHHYRLTAQDVKEENEAEEVDVSVFYTYPGSLCRNRIVEYPGEEIFGGHIGYGMNDDIGYENLKGNNTAILGNGAFAVENVRTCIEAEGKKVYLITRRKNLASPRIPCWFVHQGPVPTPGRMVLKMFEPMYELCGFGDPWNFWSVHASSDRQRVQIMQNSRFGIGDVTFLGVAWGRVEFIQDTLKRCTRFTLHLTGGRRLDNVSNISKALGLLGEYAVDRLHKMSKMVGTFCDGDWRRPLMIDATGMNAANFTTFSTGIGTTGFVRSHKFLHDHPKEYYRMAGMGFIEQLPTHKAEPKEDKPAYVSDVKYAMSSGIIMGGMSPKGEELGGTDNAYKYKMYHVCHPTDRFLAECIESWDMYQKKWKEEGWDHDYIPYPYNKDMIQDYFNEYSTHVGFHCSIDGPDMNMPDPKIATDEICKMPDWATDQGAVENVNRMYMETNAAYWGNESKWIETNVNKKKQKYSFGD